MARSFMTRFIRLAAATCFALLSALAQDITGVWQGTLKVGNNGLRLILHIAKDDQGAWTGRLQSIDQGGFDSYIPVSALTLQGSDLKLTVDAVRGAYEGKVSPAGDSIKGTWKQVAPLPLEFLRPTKETEFRDPSPHTRQFVAVDRNVQLEVLDWGGEGRPLVFLAGLGNTAHVFDLFAPKLTSAYHVYGITRRGFGDSGSPTPAPGVYAADRLGDDVLAVLDALKIVRPVLIGHSLGGEELSSVASRHPEKVSGLIYLDAGYGYAFYDKTHGNLNIDLVYLKRALDRVDTGDAAADRKVMQELLDSHLPTFERDLQDIVKNLPDAPPGPPPPPPPPVAKAIMSGVQKYTDIHVPVLAIYAVPHTTFQPFKDDAARAAAEARDEAVTGAQAKALEAGIPNAKVVRLPHANHFVFRSNEADVLREINAFLATLPR
jgi:pimeloyl-ACP methyl ester carboxylesterase